MEIIVKDLKVVVTAGGSGIGLAIAEKMVRNQAEVVVADVNGDFLADCAGRFPRITTVLCDVSDPEQVSHLFKRADQALGGLDALVNCAGITGPTARVEDISPDEWRQTIDVDLNGQFYCVREAIPRIKGAGGGSIVNMSSCSGLMGSPFRSPYCASKWAIIGLTKTMAMELGEFGIRVNALCPGIVEGGRMDRVIRTDAAHKGVSAEDIRAMYRKSISMRKFVDPEEIADLTLFLCSDSGQSISGQALGIDGNMEILR